MNSTFDVRIHGILTNTTQRGKTYTVRWKTGGLSRRETYATKALAESRRSELVVFQRQGVAFDCDSGLPEPEARKLDEKSWVELAMAYVDTRWPHWAPHHRKNTAEALTDVTLIFLTPDRGAPAESDLRTALRLWIFNTGRRSKERGDIPAKFAPAVSWLLSHTVPVSALDNAALLRKALDAISVRRDGTPAASSTISRKRTALSATLNYAVELRLFESTPLSRVNWAAPKTASDEVDRRTVVNPAQARELLAATGEIMPELEAFFGSLYYSALRPEEAFHLKDDEIEWPDNDGEWGWLNLSGATPSAGTGWGDHDGPVEDRGLKHRPRAATRRVPAPPPLLAMLRRHLETFGTGPEGRMFVTRRGKGGRFLETAGRPVSNNTYTRVWRQARAKVLTPAQQRSPLARVPYHLRHAAVSTWLNAGVPATQVAEWAGHSLNVLLRVYAKCIDGQEGAAQSRIGSALGLTQPPTAEVPPEGSAGAEDVDPGSTGP